MTIHYVASITPYDYPAFRQMCDDRFPETFEEWRVIEDERRWRRAASTDVFVPVQIAPDDLAEYCRTARRPIGGDALDDFLAGRRDWHGAPQGAVPGSLDPALRPAASRIEPRPSRWLARFRQWRGAPQGAVPGSLDPTLRPAASRIEPRPSRWRLCLARFRQWRTAKHFGYRGEAGR